jgi:hypothetical protein
LELVGSIMKIKETSHQQQFLSWCERHNFYTSHSEFDSAKKYIGCVFSVPNGGLRKAIDMVMLKREGLLTGASDVVIMLPNKVIFMEFKTDNGKQSQKQKDFQAVCGMLGLEYYLVRSSFEAVSLVKGLIC